jgi:hypothetical protein
MTDSLYINAHELSSCEETDVVVGVGGLREGPRTVLKFVYDTGDTQILYLNDPAVQHLVAVLKTLVPKFSAIAGSPVEVDVPVDAEPGTDAAQRAWSPY